MTIARTDNLITELDIIYQSCLDRMETQIRDAHVIDKAIRQILDRGDSDEAILNWDPERAMSPRQAFKALAKQVVSAADDEVTRDGGITPLDYEDLLAWPDEPKRLPGQTATGELMARIQYARRVSLRAFYDRFVVRIAPGKDPDAANASATADLMTAFAVATPERMLIPFKNHGDHRVMLMAQPRLATDLDWTISNDTLLNMTRANHALATLCQLNGESKRANNVLELNASITNQLKTKSHRYEPNETYMAGDDLHVRLCERHCDFRVSPRIWEIVHDTMPKLVSDLVFIPAAQSL